MPSLPCAADAGKCESELTSEEITKGNPGNGMPGHPAASPQDAVVSVEPELRVFGVWKSLEAGIRAERCRRPLPEIARHIEAA